jgi:hypothetical protein
MILLGMGRPAGQRETALAVVSKNKGLDVLPGFPGSPAWRVSWRRTVNLLKPYLDMQADLQSYYSSFPYDLAPRKDTNA